MGLTLDVIRCGWFCLRRLARLDVLPAGGAVSVASGEEKKQEGVCFHENLEDKGGTSFTIYNKYKSHSSKID